MKKAQIIEFFDRLAAALPEPKGELEYVNSYTLLVAVVLSAQATDVGVNKATRKLFQVADTPEKMLSLGEAGLKDHIKTIGLFNSKAKNVIALSQQLLAEHGGQVPQDRDTLVKLPGVGRKTANVVLNMAFGQETIAVDTHIFRVSNRTGLAPGKTVDAVEQKLEKVRAGQPQATRPSLADSARPLCLQGAQARVPELPAARPLRLQGKDHGRGSACKSGKAAQTGCVERHRPDGRGKPLRSGA